eukprot:CAMPEP_0194781178 /NCGR_PEP_ID=MMETSP0323_2-20130528/75606_1 /TAXON_ID=2866 ORGANISM="Crypthecodinium cohnii, Strain Seligo" /NCGR_SAMPLE_ID=MMETSP0323_2 /ASSEMBLY_ACC=CAM_ASM_000346 /LENGTH=32 /DNA_ID= /DNA_START= /DNA_END= /DNA_ORIENTATION=
MHPFGWRVPPLAVLVVLPGLLGLPAAAAAAAA